MLDTETRNRALKRGLALAGLLMLAIGGAAFYQMSRQRAPASTASAYGGSFSLVDPAGKRVTDETLKGKPFAIFFGFTRCPDVCPTTLAMMARYRKELRADGMKFNIVFVSLDPEHDKPADIGQYLTLFDTPITGLTGSPAEIAKIVKGYHVFYEKVPQPGGDYTIDHTATVFLMDADGRLQGTISHDEAPALAIEKLKMLARG